MCAERERQLARARRAHPGTAHAVARSDDLTAREGKQLTDFGVRYKGWCWDPTDPIRHTHDRRIQHAENRNNPTSIQQATPAALLCHMR